MPPARCSPPRPLRPWPAAGPAAAFAGGAARFLRCSGCFLGIRFLGGGALSRLISSNLARLRALFTLWAAAARRLVRSSSTAALASVPAAPTFAAPTRSCPGCCGSAALGTSRVDISSKRNRFHVTFLSFRPHLKVRADVAFLRLLRGWRGGAGPPRHGGRGKIHVPTAPVFAAAQLVPQGHHGGKRPVSDAVEPAQKKLHQCRWGSTAGLARPPAPCPPR